MSEEFLTIKEAAEKTGKAEITIRRFVQRVVKGNDSQRRALLQPSSDELQQHREGPPPAWRISTKLLHEQFPTHEQGSAHTSADATATEDAPLAAVLKSQNEILVQQLTVKDDQMKSKDDQIKSLTTLVDSLGSQLNERLRESNVLMQRFQEGLVIPAHTPRPVLDSPSAVETIPNSPKAKRVGKKEIPKTKPGRDGWVRRLFGAGKSTA